DVVSGIRSIRGEMNISPAKRLDASVACDAGLQNILAAHADTICALARLENLAWLPRDAELEAAAVAPLDDATVYVPLAGLVNIEEESTRLNKTQDKLAREIAKLQGRIGNPNYRKNAPAEVIDKAEQDLAALRGRQNEVQAAIARLATLK
ncbi:MAG: valine--tRNA ligase, partial [Mariprofundaceae bacterium]|nr:valine--tRNA ligase [Mariprofundaceae bacterium]